MTANTDAILVVDDDRLNRAVLSTSLKKAGYTVGVAENGEQALTLLHAQSFDLVLLDIVMPGMDGYQVCQQLKADEHTRDIPVLLISALEEIEDKVKAFTVGGVDYITKPFQFAEVLARVKTHLALRNLQKQLQQTNAELEQKLAELARSNAELRARNEELDAFAHTVAHDLKNPLQLILGYADLLAEDCSSVSPVDLQRSMASMAQGAHKMYAIIESLLLLAGVRKAEVRMTPLDMAAIVAEVQKRLVGVIDKSRAEIVLPASWPVAIGYAPWVEEMWANYISNAIKYGGQPPRVELGATLVPLAGDSGGLVRFWTRDNGRGLTLEQQASLFMPFERLGQVKIEGHGLGLSIVRRIVDKLGGQAGCESTPGQGSTFWFTLPAQ
jgi:signal transduction histidine kinase